MVEYLLYMELPFDYVSLEFESYLDKPEDINYSDPNGINLTLHFSKIIDSNFKDYINDSFKKLIPEIEIKELFTLKSLKFSLFFLIIKIDIKKSESEYFIEDQLDKLLKWFPIIFDFFPEVPRMERVITNIPITKTITDRMVGHFIGLFDRKKIRSITMADYNFQSFISEYPRLSNSNILKKLNKKLQSYYRDLFWNYNITTCPFNFYGKFPEQEGSENIAIFNKIKYEFQSYLISLYSYVGEDLNDFLREVKSFRYRMNPFEFKKLIEYEQFFEEIYDNFFSDEIPEWCRANFENWVFKHYKDKNFYLYKPVMIYRLPEFPKTYIKLRMRLKEVLNNIKNLLFSKSNLIKTFKKVDFIDKLNSIKYERDFRKEILIPILKDLDYDNIQDIHGQHEYGVDILFSNLNKFGLMEWNGIVAKKGNINIGIGTEISQNLKKLINQIYQAKIMNHLEKNYGNVKLTRVFVATNGKINFHARNILSQKDPLIEGNIFFIDYDTILSLF